MNVLLYVFDSLRPGHLSSHGYDREISPAIGVIVEPSNTTHVGITSDVYRHTGSGKLAAFLNSAARNKE
jgi:hypothetical protein